MQSLLTAKKEVNQDKDSELVPEIENVDVLMLF